MGRAARLCSAVVVILVAGCAATPPSPPPSQDEAVINEDEREIRKQAETLREIERAVERGTAESLLWAIEKLQSDDIGKSERGRELYYIGRKYLSIIYPDRVNSNGEPAAPTGSIYQEVFSEAEEGSFYEGSLMHESFLFLTSKSLAVLYTDGPQTLSLAEEALHTALTMDRESVLPHYLLGIINKKRGDIREASQNISAALKIDPDMNRARLQLAEIYTIQNRYKDAAETITHLLSVYPNNTLLLHLAAESYYHLGRYEEALSIIDLLISKTDDVSPLFLRLKVLYRQGSYERAKKILKIVDTSEEESREFLYIQADIYNKTGEPLKALEVLRRAYTLYPESPPIGEFYGRLLFENGNENRGIAVLESVLEQDPTRISTLRMLLDYSIKREEWKAAAGFLERLLDMKKSSELMRIAFTVYMERGDEEKAGNVAKELYNIDRNNPDFLGTYARTLINDGKTDEAATIIKHGLELSRSRKTKSELYYLLSLTHEDKRKSIEQLQNALFEDLRNVEALVEISDVYRELEDYSKALRYIKQAALIRPSDKEIQRKRLELEQLIE